MRYEHEARPLVVGALSRLATVELATITCRHASGCASAAGCERTAMQLIPIVDHAAALLSGAAHHTAAEPSAHYADLFALEGQLLASAMEFSALYLDVRLDQVQQCCDQNDDKLKFTAAIANGLRYTSTDVALAAARHRDGIAA